MANLTPPRLQTRAPLATDDSSAGCWLGMVWIDTVASKAYMAVSVAVGAAVWAAVGAAAVVIYSQQPYDFSYGLNELSNPALVSSSTGTIGGP